MATRAHSPEFHRLFSAAREAYFERAEVDVAAVHFEQALDELTIPDPAWASTWYFALLARCRGNDDDATLRLLFRGADQIIAAAPLLTEAQAMRWLEVSWVLIQAQMRADEIVGALAPHAVALASRRGLHLSSLAARTMTLIAGSLFSRGDVRRSAAIDDRLRRIPAIRARAMNLDLIAIRFRCSRAIAGGRLDG